MGLLRRAARPAALAAVLVAALAPPASAGQVRALLLDQRFTPGAAPRSSALATSPVILRGGTFALQVAVRPDADGVVRPRVESGAPWVAEGAELLRVGFVRIRRPSTGTGAHPGSYPDPLPPLPADGRLALTGGRYDGVVVVLHVPAQTAPGLYRAVVVLAGEAGTATVRVPLRIRVSRLAATPLADPASFTVLAVDNTQLYRARTPLPGTGGARGQATLAQADAVVRFLADHGVVTLRNVWATPDADGTYPSFTTPGAWWKDAAGNLARTMEIAQPVRAFPVAGDGFDLAAATADEVQAFFANAWAHWREHGYLDGARVYALVWDEPGVAAEAGRLPAIDRAVHAAAPGVRTLVTLWPREPVPRRRICRTFGDRSCELSRGSDYSNGWLLDGGADDVDAPAVSAHRFYGSWTSPLERANGIDHTFDTKRVIDRARRRGKEIWTYTYTIGRRGLPQLAIDAPATDVSTLLLWNALEDTQGLLHWGFARFVGAERGSTTPRDPYADPLSWRHGALVSNGEASLVYPALAPRYGLADPTAAPVSSLRMERIRAGVEAVDLVRAARARLGDARVRRLLARVFGPVRTVPGTGSTWPAYSTSAADYELVRRSLVAALEAAA